MSVTFAVAIYLVIWWTVLFAVLPIGVRTQGEEGAIVPGTPESAPAAPRLVRVVLLTTAISALVTP
jgi:predicted secreted protein